MRRLCWHHLRTYAACVFQWAGLEGIQSSHPVVLALISGLTLLRVSHLSRHHLLIANLGLHANVQAASSTAGGGVHRHTAAVASLSDLLGGDLLGDGGEATPPQPVRVLPFTHYPVSTRGWSCPSQHGMQEFTLDA